MTTRIRPLSVPLVHRLSIALVVLMCGCGGGNSNPGTSDAGPDSAMGGDGSVTGPGTFLVGETVTGRTNSYGYAVATVEVPGPGDYAVHFDPIPSGGLGIAIFADASHTTLLGDCFPHDTILCRFSTTSAGPVFIEILGGGIEEAYSFVTLRFVSEGTAASPVPLGDWTTMHSVSTSAPSFYTFVAPVAGAYALTFDTSQTFASTSVKLEFFAGADFGSAPIGSCMWVGICRVDGLPSGTIGVRAVPSGSSAQFFSLAVTHTLGEGAPTETLPVSPGTMRDGAVDTWSRSFYALTTGSVATSYVITLTSYEPSHYPRVNVYAPSDPTTTLIDCQFPPCQLSGLDPNTTYMLIVQAGQDTHFAIGAEPSGAEGSVRFPTTVTEGVSHSFTAAGSTKSYFAFTPATSGYYSLTFSSTPSSTWVYPSLWSDFTAASALNNCFYTSSSPCDLGPLEAGVTYGILLSVSGSAAVNVTFQVGLQGGEGTQLSPVHLTPELDHVGTLNPSVHPSYYSFATGAAGGSFGVAFATTASLTVRASPSGPLDPTCFAAGGATTCLFSGLPANTEFAFSVVPSTGAPIRLRLFDLAPTAGCESSATTCYTFESGTIPSVFSDASAGSAKPWKVTVASANHGTYGYEAGTGTSCFVTNTTVGTFTLAFGLDAYTSDTASGDAFTVTVDGSLVRTIPAGAAGFGRTLVAVDPAAAHTVQFCAPMSGATTHHAYVDDFAVR